MAFTDLHEIEEMFSGLSGRFDPADLRHGMRVTRSAAEKAAAERERQSFLPQRPQRPERTPEESRKARTEYMRAWRLKRGPADRSQEYADRVRKDPDFLAKRAAEKRRRRAEMSPEQLEALRAYKRVHEANRRKLGRPTTYDGAAGTNAERQARWRQARKESSRGVR